MLPVVENDRPQAFWQPVFVLHHAWIIFMDIVNDGARRPDRFERERHRDQFGIVEMVEIGIFRQRRAQGNADPARARGVPQSAVPT